jgi:hypothetical protein
MSMSFPYKTPDQDLPKPYNVYDRRSDDPLNQLGRHYNQVCITAVDALQIAAALEADSLNDTVAAHYGKADIFELAEALYHKVPLRLQSSSRFLKPRQHWRELSHGLLFALPGLFYPAVIALTDAATATVSLALAVIFGWAWSQVMVRLAYLLIGRNLIAEAAQLLRLTAFTGVTAVSLMALSSYWSLGASTFLAVGQMSYQMSAAILILYEREEWLFAAMLPGIIVSLTYLLVPAIVSTPATAVAILLSLVIALIMSVLVTQTHATQLTSALGIIGQDLWHALPFLLYGMLCALFVSFDTLRFWAQTGAGLGLSIAPLVISMGVLEWQLRRFRENVAVLLARTHNPQVFSGGVWRLFLMALTCYGCILAGLSALLFSLHGLLHTDVMRLGLLLIANLILGCAFFTGFALISQNRIGLVITYLLIALGVHMLNVAFSSSLKSLFSHTYAASYLVSCLLFTILLLSIAKSVLSEIHNYRYDLETTGYGQAN